MLKNHKKCFAQELYVRWFLFLQGFVSDKTFRTYRLSLPGWEKEYSVKLLKQISKEIMSGNIDIKPYYLKGTTPCTYCKYKSICNFDSKNKENNYRFIPHYKDTDILDKIK